MSSVASEMAERVPDQWFWSLTSSVYDLMWDGPASSALAGIVAELAGAGTSRVLDIGCGTGLVGRDAQRLGAEVIGVDSSPYMLRRALERGRVSKGLLPEELALLVPDGWADVAVVSNVLHIAPEPLRILGQAVRKVRPGGTLLISWPRDGLSPTAMLRSDLSHGRGPLRSVGAHLVRLGVGLLGGLTVAGRLRRAGSCHLQAVLSAVDEIGEGNRFALLGCQQVGIYRLQRASCWVAGPTDSSFGSALK